MKKYYMHVYVDNNNSTYNKIIEQTLKIEKIDYAEKYFKIIAISDDIINDANILYNNILLDAYYQPFIAIAGQVNDIDTSELEKRCNNIKSYRDNNLPQKNILNYNEVLFYNIGNAIKKRDKEYLFETIFCSEFNAFLDNEIIRTIDSLFENNLNLTETSKKIFIHRNTLLYRIERIKQITGYDLRKFSDAIIFKIAWVLKDKNKQKITKK